MGDLHTLQQQLEAFIRMYKEDRAANDCRQQELHAQLEALYLTITTTRTESLGVKDKGTSTKGLRGSESTDDSTLSLSIAVIRPNARASKDDGSCTKAFLHPISMPQLGFSEAVKSEITTSTSIGLQQLIKNMQEGDSVFFKLQPYRQASVASQLNKELSPHYCCSFQVIKQMGQVAYKLQLPENSKLHLVFRFSCLKKFKGNIDCSPLPPPLPPEDFRPLPQAFWDKRIHKSRT